MTPLAASPPAAPPSPPPDPALPALAHALDPAAATAAFQTWLRRSDLEIRSCNPSYIRYKPGTKAIIRYDVELAGRSPAWPRWIVAHLLPDDLAGAEFARRRVGRLVARYGRLPGMPPVADPATLLPELGAYALLFPLDPKLPGLAAAFNAAAEPDVIRYKPARKALLRFAAPNGDTGGGCYAKLSLPDLALALDHRARAFAAALRDCGVAVAAPSTWDPALAATSYPAIPGVPLRSLRGTAAALPHLPAVANMVRAIAGAVVDLPPYRPVDELATLRAAAGTLGQVVPDLQSELGDLLLTLGRGLERLDGSLRPAHGDCYDDQFLVGPAGLTLIDFDEARLAHPSLDPGNVLAHLYAATTDSADGETRQNLHRAIADLTASWAPAIGEDALAVATTAGVLKLAVGPFRRLEPAWPTRIAALLALARELVPRGASAPVPPTHPAESPNPGLPGLARALDGVHIAGLVRANNQQGDASVRLGAPKIIKHRPGRRAVVRYDLGGEPRAIFVKVFASDRAARVAARTDAVHTAVAGRVHVPRVLALDRDDRLVVLTGIAGRPLDELVRAGELDAPARAGAALAALHIGDAALQVRHGVEDELTATTRQLAGLTALDADLGRAARDAYDDVAGMLLRLDSWRYLPAHRDCHPAQILLTADAVGFIDLDDACLTEPAVDLGNLIAHLDLLAIQDQPIAARCNAAALAIVTGYRAAGGDVEDALLAACRAVALVRLAGVHAPRSGVDPGYRLLAAAQEVLASSG